MIMSLILRSTLSYLSIHFRYAALKQIKGISSEASDSLPTSSTLSSAILYEKPDTVAQLLEDGVDLNDSIKVYFHVEN